MTGRGTTTDPFPSAGTDVREAVRAGARRTAWRLLPPLAAGYLLLLLDRAVPSYVAPQMAEGLGLTVFQVGLSTPILFLGVLLFAVPSAAISGRVGAGRWLALLAAVWGCAAVATGLAGGAGTFFVARCLGSVAQAGFLPVAVFLVAGSVPASHRTRVLSWVGLTALAGAVAEPHLMGLLLRLGGALGLPGWRWLFLCLGLPCLPLALVLLWRLPRPGAGAGSWLPAREAEALGWARSVERRRRPGLSPLEALLDPPILLLAGINFGLSLSSFAAGTWYAAVMRDPRAPGLLVMGVFVVAIAATVLLWSRRVDRTGRLQDGLLISCAVATVGYAAGVFPGPAAAKLAGLVAHGATLAAARTMMWSAGSRLAFGGGGAAAVAMIDVAGLLAAFIAPRVVLGVVQQAGNLELGLIVLTAALVAATGLAGLLRLLLREG